jgi:hypothetical protein
MSEAGNGSRPDVTDMIAVHGVFRDTLAAAPRLVGEADDPERIAAVANYYENIMCFLEAHHDGEEAIVFPRLRERCPDEVALLAELEQDHKEALALLEEVNVALAAWPGGDATARAATAQALEALRVHLNQHLDKEEAQVLGLCAANLAPEEWGQLPGHAMAGYRGDKIWLILGLIRQRMNEGQREQMLAHMPPPALDMWNTFGDKSFRELSSVIVVEVQTRAPG